jgi:hypothetical protein
MNDWLYTRIYLLTDRGGFFDPESTVLRRQLAVTKELLLEGLKLATDHSATFVVLSIPQNFQVVNRASSTDAGYVDRVLGRFAADNNFAWISALPSLSETYSKEREDLYYRLDGHLNNRGNALVADIAVEQIVPILRALRSPHVTEQKNMRQSLNRRFEADRSTATENVN